MMLIVHESLRQLIHLFFDGPTVIEIVTFVRSHGHKVDGVLEVPHVDLPRLIFLTIQNVSILPMRLAYLKPERIEQEKQLMRAQ